MVALPILKSGCYWRVGNGSSIWAHSDRWISNHPTNRIFYLASKEEDGVSVRYIRRGGNMVAHALAQLARNITDEMYLMVNSPPPAEEALY